MDRPFQFARFDLSQSFGHAALAGAARVVPGGAQRFVALLGVFENVRQTERGEAPRPVEPILGIAADQAGAELRVGVKAAVGWTGGELATLQGPEELVDPHVERPELALRRNGELAVNAGNVERRRAL